MLNDIFNSCSDPHVAEAAVRSLGPSFAHQVKSAARAHGETLGTYAADAVRRFGDGASPATRQALSDAIRAADQPILAGLAFMLELAMIENTTLVPATRRSINSSPEAFANCAG